MSRPCLEIVSGTSRRGVEASVPGRRRSAAERLPDSTKLRPLARRGVDRQDPPFAGETEKLLLECHKTPDAPVANGSDHRRCPLCEIESDEEIRILFGSHCASDEPVAQKRE